MLGAVSHYVFGLSLFPSGATVAWSYAKVPLGKTKGTMNPTYCPSVGLASVPFSSQQGCCSSFFCFSYCFYITRYL